MDDNDPKQGDASKQTHLDALIARRDYIAWLIDLDPEVRAKHIESSPEYRRFILGFNPNRE